MEDPVTGSSHCSLIPYWSNVLKKHEMTAIQLSKRRGKLYCVNNKDRVLIKGKAKTYFIGNIWISKSYSYDYFSFFLILPNNNVASAKIHIPLLNTTKAPVPQ